MFQIISRSLNVTDSLSQTDCWMIVTVISCAVFIQHIVADAGDVRRPDQQQLRNTHKSHVDTDSPRMRHRPRVHHTQHSALDCVPAAACCCRVVSSNNRPRRAAPRRRQRWEWLGGFERRGRPDTLRYQTLKRYHRS